MADAALIALRMKRAVLVAAAVAIAAPLAQGQAARGRVDSVTFRSQALGTTKRYIAYTPPGYALEPSRRFPVVYYLHGWQGDETNWMTLGSLHQTLDSLAARGAAELIVVMPDGDDSWYTTWNFLGDYPGCLRQPVPHRPNEKAMDFCVPWPHYDDYIARDLVAHVDSTYRTLADRRFRGIAGLSMGGYGAIWLALAYPDVFAAAASHSGVLAPLLIAYDSASGHARYATEMAALESRYDALWPSLKLAFGRDTSGWWARDPGRRAVLQAARGLLPALYIDVGVADPYLNQSRAFRDVLHRIQRRVEYYELQGAHTWPYWSANAAYSVTFFARTLTGK